MTYKRLCTFYAAIASLSGLLCATMPSLMLASYDVQLSDMGIVIYRFWGVTLVGMGLLIWTFKDLADLKNQRKVLMILTLFNAASCFMAVLGQFNGANNFGWTTVAMYLIFSVSFGYLSLRSINRP